MPIMDGFEATKCILEINKNLAVVALTAEESPGIEDKIKKIGMKSFIRKPASSKRIMKCIMKYT